MKKIYWVAAVVILLVVIAFLSWPDDKKVPDKEIVGPKHNEQIEKLQNDVKKQLDVAPKEAKDVGGAIMEWLK